MYSRLLRTVPVLILSLIALCAAPTSFAAPKVELAVQLYTPTQQTFQPIYGADQANSARESWDSYWSWVQQFYSGNLFSPGWTAQAKSVLSHVIKHPQPRALVLTKLNSLGIEIAGEWSKDNSVRKIDTGDLGVWGAQISNAASQDTGDGKIIVSCINSIQEIVDKRLSSGSVQ